MYTSRRQSQICTNIDTFIIILLTFMSHFWKLTTYIRYYKDAFETLPCVAKKMNKVSAKWTGSTPRPRHVRRNPVETRRQGMAVETARPSTKRSRNPLSSLGDQGIELRQTSPRRRSEAAGPEVDSPGEELPSPDRSNGRGGTPSPRERCRVVQGERVSLCPRVASLAAAAAALPAPGAVGYLPLPEESATRPGLGIAAYAPSSG